ncbi:MAG: hypothetical protein Q9174_003003 [Haloplaca sp. 1 TL-2023]
MASQAPQFTTPNRKLTFLITGCSSGFGLSLARHILSNNHNLIATSRTPSKTPSLVSKIESRGGKWLKLDVNDHNSGQIIRDLEDGGTEMDVLVNNAGFGILGPIETIAADEVRAQMETMYFGPVRLIQSVVPHMRKRRFGVIVNMSSGVSLEARESMGAYAGAKGALDELAPYNIRTLTIILGTFNTSFGSSALLSRHPLPTDYTDSIAHKTMQAIQSGAIPINGYADKAMKAVFEVVTGTGVGKGKEGEAFLPLGTDMTIRIKTVVRYLEKGLEAFEEVTDHVRIDT